MANAPVRKFRSETSPGLEAAVWQGKRVLPDGREVPAYSTTFKKSYKKDGDWVETKYLYAADLAAMQILAGYCTAFIDSQRFGSGTNNGAGNTNNTSTNTNNENVFGDDDVNWG